MEMYLDIPLNIQNITQKAELQKVSMKQSIHNMIHLISTTSFGELKDDPGFGCEIWLHDFANIYNLNSLREELRQSLARSIQRNENRIKNLKVEISIEQVELSIRNRRTKVRISLIVSGIIEKTNEPLIHQEFFFIGPLSYY